MKQSKFPPGWDEERVRRVLSHYEEQTEEEAFDEDEAAVENKTPLPDRIKTADGEVRRVMVLLANMRDRRP